MATRNTWGRGFRAGETVTFVAVSGGGGGGNGGNGVAHGGGGGRGEVFQFGPGQIFVDGGLVGRTEGVRVEVDSPPVEVRSGEHIVITTTMDRNGNISHTSRVEKAEEKEDPEVQAVVDRASQLVRGEVPDVWDNHTASQVQSVHRCRRCGTFWMLWKPYMLDGRMTQTWSLALESERYKSGDNKCCESESMDSLLVPPPPWYKPELKSGEAKRIIRMRGKDESGDRQGRESGPLPEA